MVVCVTVSLARTDSLAKHFRSFVRSLTHSLARSIVRSLARSLAYSLTHLPGRQHEHATLRRPQRAASEGARFECETSCASVRVVCFC